jgi:16S rRNA (uracil1498-N3)-methyltransferase
MNLILLEPHEIGADGRAVLRDGRAAHLRDVLKAAPGQTVRVGVLDGPRGKAVVEKTDSAEVVLKCALEPDTPTRPRVDLLLALPRPKVMRRLWAQLAAMGVGRIILTNAYKVERVYFDTHWLGPETYRPLLIEGLQQAQDTRLPEVTIHRQLKVLVEDELDALCPAGLRLLADPGATQRIGDLAVPDPSSRILLAVGPEGGWTDYERKLLQDHGFRAASMGTRTLRSDTACVALLALAHEALPREG